MRRHGITLIEVLIVVSIIALLGSLIVIAAQWIGEASREASTRQRMEQIFTQIAMKGRENLSVTYAMQKNVSGFGGTTDFYRSDTLDYAQPLGGAAWHSCWPKASSTHPVILSYPWGKSRLYQIYETWYTTGVSPTLTSADSNTWTPQQRTDWETAEPHSISFLTPRKSAEIFQACTISPSATSYRDDRTRSQNWNDAWGNPLVISYAIFQPTECGPSDTVAWQTGTVYQRGQWVLAGTPTKWWFCIVDHTAGPANQASTTGGLAFWLEKKKDDYLKESFRLYRTNRSSYYAVGAVGPTLDATRFPSGLLTGQTATVWNGYLDNLWSQILEGTLTTKGVNWTSNSFDNPPWDGILVGRNRSKGWRCLLTAPKEME